MGQSRVSKERVAELWVLHDNQVRMHDAVGGTGERRTVGRVQQLLGAAEFWRGSYLQRRGAFYRLAAAGEKRAGRAPVLMVARVDWKQRGPLAMLWRGSSRG
jgi:hypothetical protein